MIDISKKSITKLGTLISAALLLLAVGACNNNTTTAPTESETAIEPTTEEQMTAPKPVEPGAPAQQPGAAQEIGDEDLNSFARAYMAVQEMSPQYQEQLLNATPEEATEIERQAAEAMQREIEKHDMTFEQFTMIAVRLESDPLLQQRFNEVLQNMQVQEPVQE